jgi:hypothetical protein
MQQESPAPKESKAEDRPLSLAERADKGEALTIDELADVTGNAKEVVPTMFLSPELTPSRQFSREHLAAAQLHGWAAHPMHSAEPLLIKRDDYLKALEAAKSPPKGAREYVPHAAACSEFAPVSHKELKARADKQIADQKAADDANAKNREELAKARAAKAKERS